MYFLVRNKWTIIIIACLLYIPFIGHVHLFDWDEINFAESAREMMVSHHYFEVQINFEQFWEKPPLFFWIQVLSMRLFGVNEFAARFPNALCGVVTLLILFHIGKKIYNLSFARVWVMVYMGTILPFVYFKTGIIDPWFNLFIFLSLWHLYQLTQSKATWAMRYGLLSGIFLGLAILTKGPVALLLLLFTYIVYVLLHKGKLFFSWASFLAFFLACFIICFAWFGVDLIEHGPWFLVTFLKYQFHLMTRSEADHGEPFFYHWWVLLIGCFPASIFFIRAMFKRYTVISNQQEWRKWNVILFWVTLFVFSIVKTKIVHYSSLCWFPLCFIAALLIYEQMEGHTKKYVSLVKIGIGILGVLLSFIVIAIPWVMNAKDRWLHLVKDPFVMANLQATVIWHWYNGIGGMLLLIGLIYYLWSKKSQFSIPVLFLSTMLFAYCALTIYAPKIEAISQNANIDFFQQHQHDHSIVETYNYKSYAQYFYTKKDISINHTYNMDSLLYGNMPHHSVFISARINATNILDTIPTLRKLYEKNGFVFYERK